MSDMNGSSVLSVPEPRHAARPLAPTMEAAEWGDRFSALHRQLYASDAAEFEDVMQCIYRPPAGYVLADHCIVRDSGQWHFYYITGLIDYAEEWIGHLRAGRFVDARKRPYESGDGHAIGPKLNQLQYHGMILEEVQGDFGIALQGTSNVVRLKDEWVNIYTARGPQNVSLCLARSRDLMNWVPDAGNPFWRPPEWAAAKGTCKNAHVIRYPGTDIHLIYYCVTMPDGCCAIALISTKDFKHYSDHGPVMKMPHQLRGTQGMESPCVVLRNGMWHLFFGCGEGVWHAVSPSPDQFMRGTQHYSIVSTPGAYLFGRYHAIEVFEHAGKWFMTSTRKEYQRYLNRRAGVLKFRGSVDDETAMLAGLFLAGIEWVGDQPCVRRLGPDEIP